jgi:hypothetical protein
MFHRKIKNCISIVEKVIYRSLTGHTLGLTIHNHSKSQIHLCWSNKTGTPKYNNALERSFFGEIYWLHFCEELKMTRMIGLAACILCGIIYEEDHRLQRCIFLENATWGSRNVWKTYRQKCLKTRSICFCPVSSSSVIRQICVL